MQTASEALQRRRHGPRRLRFPISHHHNTTVDEPERQQSGWQHGRRTTTVSMTPCSKNVYWTGQLIFVCFFSQKALKALKERLKKPNEDEDIQSQWGDRAESQQSAETNLLLSSSNDNINRSSAASATTAAAASEADSGDNSATIWEHFRSIFLFSFFFQIKLFILRVKSSNATPSL